MRKTLLQGARASAIVAATREANKFFRLHRRHACVTIRGSPTFLDDITFWGFGGREGSSQGGSLVLAATRTNAAWVLIKFLLLSTHWAFGVHRSVLLPWRGNTEDL